MVSFRSISRFFRNLLRPVGAVTRQIFRVTSSAFFGIWRWGRSRNWIYFLLGLPALLMAILVVALISLRLAMSAQGLEAKYLDTARSAYRSRNFVLSLVAYERLR